MASRSAPRARSRHSTRRLLSFFALALLTVATSGCRGCREQAAAGPAWSEPSHRPHSGAATVWAIDDGARVGRRAGGLPLMCGEENPVWSPGQPARLFGLPSETVAFQVVVTAGSQPLVGVTAELGELRGPSRVLRKAPTSGSRGQRAIERFVVCDLPLQRRSGGRHPGESLGWAASSTPPDPARGGLLPDPLIPVALAPSWADYPMSVATGEHRVVWFDVTLPWDLPAGTYSGAVQVSAAAGPGAGARTPVGRVPVQLEVGATPLPYAAVGTMVYFDPEEIVGRTGKAEAVRRHQQLLHRHHLSTIFPIRSAAEVSAHRAALSGALYAPEHGYHGPGIGLSASVVAIGAYGSLREPTPERLAEVDAILAALAELGLEDRPGERDIFLYAVDEQCDSDRGPRWKAALAASESSRLRQLRVGHTCSEPPASQPVDLVMMFASAYDPKLVQQARQQGQRVWIYNGALPETGTFLTDGPFLSLRANAWIQGVAEIERWFYWESTFWNDDNRGGQGPYDPWARAETFHNQHGDHCNGDGVLVYPGRQQLKGYRSLGFAGVLPSLRLKQWRRGISDMGYLQLARAVDRRAADGVARKLIPRALRGASSLRRPAWPTHGAPYFEARRALFELIRRR